MPDPLHPVTALTSKGPGETYRVVTSRRERRCDDGNAAYPAFCRRTIAKGERYIRAVMFPNHDVYSYVDETGKPLRRPIVTALCFGCAAGYYRSGLLVIDAERQARRRELAERGGAS